MQRTSSVQNRGVLTALRAAAIVIVATGLNDVIAGAAPRYEPLYAYLAAIALVVLLDGIILGAFAAILSLGFYALLFLPRATLLRALPFPLIAVAITMIVAAAIRALVRSRRRAQPIEVFAPSPPPLLAPPPPPLDNSEVLGAIDDLRDELRTAITEISASREHEEMLERTFLEAREALVTRLRIAEEEARVKDAELRRQLDAERAAFEVARTEALSLAAEEVTLANRVKALETTLETDRARAAAISTSHEHRIAELNAEAEQLRVGLDAERERTAIQERRVAELNAEHAQLRTALETERKRALDLSAEIANERERSATALHTESARAATNAAAHERRIAELDEEAEQLRVALETERSNARDSSAAREQRIAELNEEAEQLRVALETERTRALELSKEIDTERQRVESTETERTRERGNAETARSEIEKLQRMLTGERATLAARTTEIETARNEATALQNELSVTREQLQSSVAEAIARATDLATLRRDLEIETARADAEKSLRERAEQDVALLESRLAELDALRSTTESELRASFDEKLNTIVTHLAQDHEADLGKSVLEREEARAEARSANAKLSKLQVRVEEERQAILAKLREADERHRTAIADANQLLAETRSAAQKEIERLQLRIAELEQQRAQVAETPQPSRGRVLIAHPDPEMRATARASLERAGYEIVSAADGLEALRTAIAQHPDVVIADAVMPKMNGRELCQLLKSQEKTANIRVILLTRANDDMPKGDIPPDLLLRKPVPLETLKTTLAELVTRA